MTSILNLSSAEWAKVLESGTKNVETVAGNLKEGRHLVWADTLLGLVRSEQEILDLGSGLGEHSAFLALNGKKTTLVDWSPENLAFSRRLFEILKLDGHFLQADITQPLLFDNDSFDVVFSCGVFEYFTDDQIRRILAELFRVARKKVIVMVPNALSLPYRLGKWHMEKSGKWKWGGERPFRTLRPYFRAVHAGPVTEFSVAERLSLDFLTMRHGRKLKKLLTCLLGLRDHSGPSFLNQGYLLVSAAQKRG